MFLFISTHILTHNAKGRLKRAGAPPVADRAADCGPQRHLGMQKTDFRRSPFFVSALPIFPARLQASIFGAGELNCRVRNGNGWTLTAISTDLLFFEKKSKQKKLQRTFFSLPFFSTISHYIQFSRACQERNGDPCGNRTHVCGVRGRRLNRLTNGPHMRVAGCQHPQNRTM